MNSSRRVPVVFHIGGGPLCEENQLPHTRPTTPTRPNTPITPIRPITPNTPTPSFINVQPIPFTPRSHPVQATMPAKTITQSSLDVIWTSLIIAIEAICY